MWSEFDQPESSAPQPTARPTASTGRDKRSHVPRLISRLFAGADAALRAQMLGCLLQPLGVLGLVGAAAGEFAGLLHHRLAMQSRITIDEVAAFTSGHILELARFVEHVDPSALRQAADLAAACVDGEFSSRALALLYRSLDDVHPA